MKNIVKNFVLWWCGVMCLPLQVAFCQNNPLSLADTTLAINWFDEGLCYAKAYEFKQAVYAYEEAAQLYQALAPQVNDSVWWDQTVHAWNAWGDMLFVVLYTSPGMSQEKYTTQKAKATWAIRQAQAMAKLHLGDHHELLAEGYAILGKMDAARTMKENLAFLDSAMVIHELNGHPMHKELAQICSYYGMTLRDSGHFQMAIPYFERALDVAKHTSGENSLEVAHIYNSSGINYDLLGWHEKAIETIAKSLDIKRLYGQENNPRFINGLNNLGGMLINQGDYAKGEAYLNEAAGLVETHDLSARFPYLLNLIYQNLGNSVLFQGKWLEALKRFRQHVAYVSRHYERPEQEEPYLLSIAQIGEMHTMLGAMDSARKYLHWSKELMDNLSSLSKRNRSVMLGTIGICYVEFQEFGEGLDYLNQALALGQEIYALDHLEMLRIHLAKVNALYQMGAYDEGLATLDQLIRDIPAGGSVTDSSIWANPVLVKAWRLKGEIYLGKAKSSRSISEGQRAMAAFENALALHDTLFRIFTYEASQRTLLKEAERLYKGGIACAFLLDELTKNTTYQELAFSLAERSKAAILKQAVGKAHALSYAGIPDEVLVQEKRLKRLVFQYQQEVLAEKAKGPSTDLMRLHALRQRGFAYHQQLDSLQQALQQDYPQFYQLQYADLATNRHSIQLKLDDHTGLLQYFWGDTMLYRFWIRKNEFQCDLIPISQSFTDSLHTFIAWLKAYDEVHSSKSIAPMMDLSHQIYLRLIGPSLPNDISKLVIIPDGPLYQLPFEALLTTPPSFDNGHLKWESLSYLQANIALRYSYSAALMEASTPPEVGTKGIGAFAPSYPKELAEVTVGDEFYPVREGLSSLNYNVEEVTSIMKFATGDTFVGKAATEAAFKAQAGRFRLLHLAMHADMNDSLPELSGMAFYPEFTDSLNNGYLTTGEVYGLSLPAQLAILSACNTGNGQYQPGEGVISIARAFRYAGVPNLVYSLWQVDDEATALFMASFYEFLAKGLPKDQALQKAKQTLMQDGYAHPYYWAPFLLLGDDQPVELGASFWGGQMNIWGVILAIGLLLGIVYMLIARRRWFRWQTPK